MNRSLILLTGLLVIPLTVQADDETPTQADKDKQEKKQVAKTAKKDPVTIEIDGQTLHAMYRFYDVRLHEHVYTYGTGEPESWRKLPYMKYETVLGYMSTRELPGTKRLYRAIRPDGLHYFYLQAPKGKSYSIEDCYMFVWTRKKEGMIPIHACFFPDGTDRYFDPDFNNVRKFVKGTKTSIGRKRYLNRSLFYIYAKPETDSAQKQIEKKD